MNNIYRDGHVHVLADRCSTCIFRAGNLMQLAPGRVKGMVEQTEEDGATVPCHQTLVQYDGPMAGRNAICRGWWDAYARKDAILQFARAAGILRWQTP